MHLENSESLVGYIHEVSPTKVSIKGSSYLSFYIQDKERVSKAICFSPEKRKLVESKAESCTPCKVTKYNKTKNETDGNVLWINNSTRIDDAPDTLIDFPYTKIKVEVPSLTSINDLQNVQVNQLVTLHGKVLFGTNKSEKVGSKGLVKIEGFLVDETGSIAVTVWNDQIAQLEDGNCYEAHSVRLRQYNGEKYITTTPTSTFQKLLGCQLSISEEIIKDAVSMLQSQEISCQSVQTVEITQYYSSIACAKRVQSRPDSKLTKCDNCHVRFLLEKSKKNITARISIKTSEANTQLPWYSLFSSTLEEIINNYNQLHSPQ